MVRRTGRGVAAFAAVLFSNAALGEILVDDASVEISGTGPRSARTCTVLLKPTLTAGDSLAPRLLLVTTGTSRLSFGLDRPTSYANAVVVQNNLRKPFVGVEDISRAQFYSSEIGKAIKSGRLFFVTAQHGATRKFVSSRYERIDFDAILAKVEAVCPVETPRSFVPAPETPRSFVPAPEPPRSFVPKQNFWSLNDSKLSLRAESGKPERIFVYDQPSAEARSAGAASGAVVFKGVRAKDRYAGKIYAFSRRCAPAPYDVTGTVSSDQRQVTLSGRAPLRDAGCKVTGYRDETLVFTFHDAEDNWGEARN